LKELKSVCTTNFTNNNISVGSNYVKLPKVGRVKAKISLDITPLKIKSATVTQNRDDSYQVSVLVEYNDTPIPVKLATEENTIGLDYKSDGLYVDSNGIVANMPHYYRKSAKQLAKRQRKLKNKVVGSNNYYKKQRKVAKIHRHIANQRKDYLHKKSIEIANQYGFVCVEDLNMKAISNKRFGNGKATLDNGYGMFLVFLAYKLKERGGVLVKVDKFYPSSQLCSCCGYRSINLKDLAISEWFCPNCGSLHNRDTNAALNIKMEGLRLLQVA